MLRLLLTLILFCITSVIAVPEDCVNLSSDDVDKINMRRRLVCYWNANCKEYDPVYFYPKKVEIFEDGSVSSTLLANCGYMFHTVLSSRVRVDKTDAINNCQWNANLSFGIVVRVGNEHGVQYRCVISGKEDERSRYFENTYKPTPTTENGRNVPNRSTRDSENPTKTPIFTSRSPLYTTEKTVYTTRGPVYSTEMPFSRTRGPENSIEKPLFTTRGPVNLTQKPFSITRGQVNSTEKPFFTIRDPVNSTAKPFSTISSRVNTIQKPFYTTRFPMYLTEKLFSVTRGPVNSTKKPFSTTRGPVNSTEKQFSAISSRVNTIQKPFYTTIFPVYLTEKPFSITRGPVNSIEMPFSTSRGPVNPIQKPFYTTRGPVYLTEKTFNTTRGPVHSTEKPFNTTGGSAYLTEKPFSITSGPVNSTERPFSTARGPVYLTEKSFYTTSDSVNPEQKQQYTTKGPEYSTEKLLFNTTNQAYSTEKPYHTTDDPVFLTEMPHTMRGPVYSTETPVFTTTDHTYSTEKPLHTTASPIHSTEDLVYTTKEIQNTTEHKENLPCVSVDTSVQQENIFKVECTVNNCSELSQGNLDSLQINKLYAGTDTPVAKIVKRQGRAMPLLMKEKVKNITVSGVLTDGGGGYLRAEWAWQDVYDSGTYKCSLKYRNVLGKLLTIEDTKIKKSSAQYNEYIDSLIPDLVDNLSFDEPENATQKYTSEKPYKYREGSVGKDLEMYRKNIIDYFFYEPLTFGNRTYQLSKEIFISDVKSDDLCRLIVGGYLAEMDDAQEYDAVAKYLRKHEARDVIIGGTNEGDVKVWKFRRSGREVLYFRWGDGEPSNTGGKEHCLAILTPTNDLMDDIKCRAVGGKNYQFVCETDV